MMAKLEGFAGSTGYDIGEELAGDLFAKKQEAVESGFGSLTSAVMSQVSPIPSVWNWMSDGETPVDFTNNEPTDDGFNLTNEDVKVSIAKLGSLDEDDLNRLSLAKNYGYLNRVISTIDERNKDFKEISEWSPLLTVPMMLAGGAVGDPVGTISGLGAYKLAKNSLLAMKTIKNGKTATLADLTKGDIVSASVFSGGTSGFASETALQAANSDINQEGIYVSALASMGFSGLMTGAFLRSGKQIANFEDSALKPADVIRTDVSELAPEEFTAAQRIMGKFSLNPVVQLRTSKNASVQKFAKDAETSPIMPKDEFGRVIPDQNQNAMDIKLKHHGKALKASMDIEDHINSVGRPELEESISNEMFAMEAEYNKFKDDLFETEAIAYTKDKYEFDIREMKDKYNAMKSEADADIAKIDRKMEKALSKLKQQDPKDVEFKDIADRVESQYDNWLNSRMGDIADADIRKGVQLANKYLTGEGRHLRKVGMKGFEDVDHRFYITHRFDPSKMAANQVGAEDAMKRALIDMVRSDMTPELEAEIGLLAKKEVQKIIDNHNINDTLDPDRGMLFELNKSLQGGTVFKGRKLYINAKHMSEFMNNRITDIIQEYGHKVSGKIALKEKYNIDKGKTAKDFIAENFTDATASEKKNIQHIIGSIDGSGDVDPFSASFISKGVKTMTTLNYANFGGFFGANTLSELGSAVALNGTNIYKHIVPAMKQTIDVAKKNSAMNHELSMLRVATEQITNNRMNLFADPTLSPTSGTYDMALNKVGAAMSKYSGLTTVTDILDRAVSLSFVHRIKKGKMTKGDLNDLAYTGLTMDDVKKLRDIEFEKMEGDTVVDFDYSKIKDDALRNKVRMATGRNARNSIIKGDSVNLPRWMVNIQGSRAFPKLIFQFMRFPVLAHSKITLRMMDNPRMINHSVGLATSGLALWMVEELRDLNRDKPLSAEKKAMKIAERLPMLSGFGLSSQVSGQLMSKEPSDVAGVSAQRFTDFMRLTNKIKNGEDINSHDAQIISSLGIGYTFPVLNQMYKALGAEIAE